MANHIKSIDADKRAIRDDPTMKRDSDGLDRRGTIVSASRVRG